MSGVRVMMGRDENDGVPHWEHSACDHHCGPGQWFPEPQASRLIDPDDPQVRERLVPIVAAFGHTGIGEYALMEGILAALKATKDGDA